MSFYCFPSLISIFFGLLCWNFEITIWVHFKVSCHTFVVNLDSRWNSSINFVVSWQDVYHEDDNCDDDGRHEANLEGNMLLWKWRYEANLEGNVFIFLQKGRDRNKKGYYITWCLNCSLTNSITTYWSIFLDIINHL